MALLALLARYKWLLCVVGLAGLTGVGLFVRYVRRTRAVLARAHTLRELKSRANTDASLVMQVIGGYRLVDELGRGGMAVVYRGLPEDSLDETEAVAVKVLSRTATRDDQFMGRYRREVLITRDLSHPNVVRLVDWGEQDGYFYLVMELLEGSTVCDSTRGRRLSPAEAMPILEGICAGVHHAHKQGVVHRDLKPENIMLSEKGLVKVTDFGLARAEDSERITKTGAAMGTPAYMAPEQIRGEEPDPRTDQYAFGVMAYEFLVGKLPFDGTDPIELIFKQIAGVPPVPSSVNPDLSPEVDAVLLRMLAKAPEHRFLTLEEAFLKLKECALVDTGQGGDS